MEVCMYLYIYHYTVNSKHYTQYLKPTNTKTNPNIL